MEYLFTVPEEEYDNVESSDFDYIIFEDESVVKQKSQQYNDLVAEMERYKKFQEENNK